jgi:hypothetical protein
MAEIVKLGLMRKSEASKARVEAMRSATVTKLRQCQQEDEERQELESRKRHYLTEFDLHVSRMDTCISREWAITQLERAIEKLRS